MKRVNKSLLIPKYIFIPGEILRVQEHLKKKFNTANEQYTKGLLKPKSFLNYIYIIYIYIYFICTLCLESGWNKAHSLFKSHQQFQSVLTIATPIHRSLQIGYVLEKKARNATCRARKILRNIHISTVSQKGPLSLALDSVQMHFNVKGTIAGNNPVILLQ